MLELCCHGHTIQHKVRLHPLHQGGEADIGVGLVSHGDQDGAGQVGHALAVAYTVVVQGIGG